MPVFNYPGKEVNIKIVYYGPGLSGKTTNIQYIHENIRPEVKGKLVSLATQTDRTLFFDFLPMELGTLGGYKIRLHLYTVPGQVHYNATRKLVLKGVDGVVLVADSQKAMKEANLESLGNLEKNLQSYGKDLESLPHLIQGNKRDLDDLLSIDELNSLLNRYDAPFMEAVGTQGIGVLESLREILKLVMRSMKDQFPLEEPVKESDTTEPVEDEIPLEEDVAEEIQPVDGLSSDDKINVEPVLPEEAEIMEAAHPEDSLESSPPMVDELEVGEEQVEDQSPEHQSVEKMRAGTAGENGIVVSVPVPGGGEVELTVHVSARLINLPSPSFPEDVEVEAVAVDEQKEPKIEDTTEELSELEELSPIEDVVADLDEEVQLSPHDEPLGEPLPDPHALSEMEPLPLETSTPDSLEHAVVTEGEPIEDETLEEKSAEDKLDTPYDPSFEELAFSDDSTEISEADDLKKKGKKKGLLGMFKKKA
jgi:signal recognition particle receptor subunit beta